MPQPVPTGLPGELLERRADVRAAERQVAVAFQRIQVAKAAKLPSIKLTGSGGRSSNELIDLIGASKGFLSLGSNLLAPLDIGGALQNSGRDRNSPTKSRVSYLWQYCSRCLL